jgi:hypothetical protein
MLPPPQGCANMRATSSVLGTLLTGDARMEPRPCACTEVRRRAPEDSAPFLHRCLCNETYDRGRPRARPPARRHSVAPSGQEAPEGFSSPEESRRTFSGHQQLEGERSSPRSASGQAVRCDRRARATEDRTRRACRAVRLHQAVRGSVRRRSTGERTTGQRTTDRDIQGLGVDR